MTDLVQYEMSQDVVSIRLNRPKRHNAVDAEMRTKLIDAWARFEHDTAAKVAVLCASGDRSFCSGRDMRSPNPEGVTHRNFLPILGDVVQVSKPVIAAVGGDALGGGWFMAQMCDLVIAADHACFGLPEVKAGRIPIWAVELRGVISEKHILQVMLTGQPVSAQDAWRMGLVNAVVPGEHVMDTAMDWARQIAANAPLAVSASRRLVYESKDMTRAQALAFAFSIAEPVMQSRDAKEGLQAFLEKRRPVWHGC